MKKCDDKEKIYDHNWGFNFQGTFQIFFLSQDFKKEEKKSLNRNSTQRAHTDSQKDVHENDGGYIFPFQQLESNLM